MKIMAQEKYNVLVTGVGAIIGYGIVQNLKRSHYDCRIVGMDIYPDAVGQAWTDVFVQSIPAVDEHYVDFVLDIMQRYDIDLVMFGTEQEITRLSDAREQFGAQQSKLVLNRSEIVDLSNDKWSTHEFLTEHDLPTIPSMIEGSFADISQELGCPFLFKPRQSYAGKGMATITTEKELDFYRKQVPSEQFMVQMLIGDNEHEYTTATFGFGDGTGLEPIVLRRKLSQEGATAKATRIDCPALSAAVEQLTRLLKPIGPTNYQFRKDGDIFYLLEVNPRISSSTSIRAALGYNEAEMCIDWFVRGQKPLQPSLKDGTAIRYISDWIQGA